MAPTTTTTKKTAAVKTMKKAVPKAAETPVETPAETAAETPAETPVVETPVETTVEVPAATPKKAAKSAAAKSAEVQVELPATAETPAEPVSFETLLLDITSRLIEQEKGLRTTKALLKKLTQVHSKTVKAAGGGKKKGKKDKDPNAPKRKPSGFALPTLVSDELAAFLSLDPTTKVARTEVIKLLSTYIKANNLENPANRREIFANDALKKLLGSGDGLLSYFTLQRALSRHFIKNTPISTV